jgi:hypothetical protein
MHYFFLSQERHFLDAVPRVVVAGAVILGFGSDLIH